MPRLIRFAVPAAAALLALGACGSDSEPRKQSGVVETTSTTVAPRTPTTVAPTTTATAKPTTTTTAKPTTTTTAKPTTTTASPTTVTTASSAYYANCDAARAAGAAPLHVGDPGYRTGLDRDHDGVACE